MIFIASVEDKREFEHKPRVPEIPSVKGDLESKTAAELSAYIGRQRNRYGRAMGSVVLAEGATVSDEVRNLLKAGIEARGYQLVVTPTSNAVNLDVDIEKFWAWFVPSFFTMGFESQLELNLQSTNGDISKTATVKRRT
jgi:hypothetical protein